MKIRLLLWIVAFLITILTAYYQRLTGPTYPLKGSIKFSGEIINYKLDRSHGGSGDQIVAIKIPDQKIKGSLYYKRYKTNDAYTEIKMHYTNGELKAGLLHQPPAGKLEYYIKLYNKQNVVHLPENRSVVTRFKGYIPLYVLIPHILAMFTAMLLSVRTGLEIFNKSSNLKKLTYWTIAILFIGGLILGPIVQKYAFGALWTGVPFGWDLTDNKTLIAFLGWLIALFMYGKSKRPKLWATAASILLIVVYLIPHSVMGSELDYNKLDKQSKQPIENIK